MNNWISVDDALPEEEYIDVLVWPRHHGEYTAFIINGPGHKWYFEEYDSTWGMQTKCCTVTHWQPLPEGPK